MSKTIAILACLAMTAVPDQASAGVVAPLLAPMTKVDALDLLLHDQGRIGADEDRRKRRRGMKRLIRHIEGLPVRSGFCIEIMRYIEENCGG